MMVVETLTPEMTPSPSLKPVETRDYDLISPVSPLPPPKEQLHPFRYETVAPPDTQTKAKQQAANPAAPDVYAPSALIERRASEETASIESTEPDLPGSTIAAASSNAASTTTLNSTVEDLPVQSPLPFTPLTRQSVAIPENLIPNITNKHLQCYSSHKINLWSMNQFQPMGCMICHLHEEERKWMCTWCLLRICVRCSGELRMVPGRDLQRLLNARAEAETESGVDEQQGGVVARINEEVCEEGRVIEDRNDRTRR
jgi:hypothetical protein